MPYAELTRDSTRLTEFAVSTSCSPPLWNGIPLEEYHREAEQAVQELQEVCKGKSFVGQVVNGNPLEMALALLKLGFEVKLFLRRLRKRIIHIFGKSGNTIRTFESIPPFPQP